MHGQKNMDTGWVQGELDLSPGSGQAGIPDLHFPEPVKEISLGAPDIVFPAVQEAKEGILRDAARELPDDVATGEKPRSGLIQGVLRGLLGRVK